MNLLNPVPNDPWRASGTGRPAGSVTRHASRVTARAFTLIEIAISLAIIGFAVLAIVGVLPIGMNTQRDNREETIINQDATVLMEAIRTGARGADYLTNYVYAISNYWQDYDDKGVALAGQSGVRGYTSTAAYNNEKLTNATRIIGLLSTPEYTGPDGMPVSSTFTNSFTSNRVYAYVRAISGLAVEKPPQDNQIMREDALTYRLLCVNAPMPVETNTFNHSPYAQQLAAAQRELRLSFSWPLMPSGKLLNNGSSPLTFRATVAGRIEVTNYYNLTNQWLYFYQPQSFTNAP
jgi:type II secretory pathway pseudopilin PulG